MPSLQFLVTTLSRIFAPFFLLRFVEGSYSFVKLQRHFDLLEWIQRYDQDVF